MRALFVNENIGGHASVHATLRRVLAEHGDSLGAAVGGLEVDVLDVPPPTLLRRAVGTAVPGLGRLDLDLQPLRAQLALSRWVRRELEKRMGDYDVVHVYTGNAALLSADLLASMPSVVATDATNVTNAYRLPYREPTRFTPLAVRAAQRWERPVYDAATLVVANTEWVAGSLRDDYGLTDETLRVFPFGIHAPDLGPGAAPGTAVGPDLPRLVFVGRQLERKGALRLHRLHQEHLADECELVLVTPEDAPPGRNVRVVGDVTVGSPRLWEELRAAAAFVFPSTIDQAPNAVIEALAAGLPVIGLDLAAMTEMVPADCGSVVAPDDDAALVAAVGALVRDPALRARQGAAARERFLERYDAVAATARVVATLAEAHERFHASRGTDRVRTVA